MAGPARVLETRLIMCEKEKRNYCGLSFTIWIKKLQFILASLLLAVFSRLFSRSSLGLGLKLGSWLQTYDLELTRNEDFLLPSPSPLTSGPRELLLLVLLLSSAVVHSCFCICAPLANPSQVAHSQGSSNEPGAER